jgi:tight adherence protein B
MRFITVLIISFIVLAAILFTIRNIKISSKLQKRADAWPEALDLIISSLQSGASISESLSMLGKVGPHSVRGEFGKFTKRIEQGENFELALDYLKHEFADPVTDQLFEVLYFSSQFGGRNTIKVLRELSEYLAADLSLRSEIKIRYGWIKNSANLAALAPWLLFLILRTQENAKIAYAQVVGQVIIILGVLLTIVAYLWMHKIAMLPKPKRLFRLNIIANG